MANELTIVETNVLNADEKNELSTSIDRIIAAHKNNRQEINRLVFESVAAMTEADNAQNKLSNKGFFRRFIGGISGSNQKLQNKINSNRAAAQYAAQQTLQKLAEQNLMTFDLITAVNNKLNASLYEVNEEFSRIYTGLEKFFKHSRNKIVRLETRLAKVEQNVQLLTWQNSVEYLEFDGEEYVDMDDAKKIVCLVRDFYDITKGNWTTSDLLLLKTAMATIGIQPKIKVNYFGVLKEIEYNKTLKDKLFNGMEIRPIEDPSYLIAMGTLQKMNSLNNEENYIVDSVMKYMNQQGIETNRERICDDLTIKYLQESAFVNINTDIESYDMILDLLYNLKQADYKINLALNNSQGKLNLSKENPKSIEKQNKLAYTYESGKCIIQYYNKAIKQYTENAKEGDAKAQYKLGLMYEKGKGITQNYTEAFKWYTKSAEQEYVKGQYKLGFMYEYGYGIPSDEKKTYGVAAGIVFNIFGNLLHYKNAIDWYEKAAKQGDDKAQYKLGFMYEKGKGVEEDIIQAVKWYTIAAKSGNIDAKKALKRFPNLSNTLGIIGNISSILCNISKPKE